MHEPGLYYEPLAAAYIRGSLLGTPHETDSALFRAPLASLDDNERAQLIEIGRQAGLRLHRFKRTMGLPRVIRVLGVLRGLQPADLLDIGSGRGAFLWPLLDAFPGLPVTTVDRLEHRVRMLQTVAAGGVSQLAAYEADAGALPFVNDQFDVVTALEVLEHIPDAGRALTECCRVARRFVIVSCPSRPDDNPEHIHLFDPRDLARRFAAQSFARVTTEQVLNHVILVARRSAP